MLHQTQLLNMLLLVVEVVAGVIRVAVVAVPGRIGKAQLLD
jgi:hypothetical protein